MRERKGQTGDALTNAIFWAIFIAAAGYGIWALVQKLTS